MPTLDQFNQSLSNDPKYQDLVKAVMAGQTSSKNNGNNILAMKSYAQDQAQQQGINLPQDMDVSAANSGQYTKDAPWDWGKAALALTPLAAGLGAAALGVGGGFGAAGGGAAGGAAAGGSGLAAGTGADVAGASALGGGGVLSGLPGAMTALPTVSGVAGAGSALSGVLSGLPGEMTSLPGAGSTMAGQSIADILAANSPQMIPNSLATSLTPAELAGVSSGGASGAGGIMSKLLSDAGQKTFSNISSGLGSLTQGIANNRALQGNFTQQYDRNAIAAQDSANTARAAALKNLAQANYLKSKTGGYTPTSIQLNGQTRQLPNFGSGPIPISDAQRQGANDLETNAKKILAPGGTVTPQPLSSYATPGTGEQIGNAGAAITGMLPAAVNIWKMFSS